MRNEYESKIYELNDDINFLNRQLKQKEIDLTLSRELVKQNENFEIIQELTEKNQNLLNQLKAVRFKNFYFYFCSITFYFCLPFLSQ